MLLTHKSCEPVVVDGKNVSYRPMYWLMVSSAGGAVCEVIETLGNGVAGRNISPG